LYWILYERADKACRQLNEVSRPARAPPRRAARTWRPAHVVAGDSLSAGQPSTADVCSTFKFFQKWNGLK
jgi:hypothetical protein